MTSSPDVTEVKLSKELQDLLDTVPDRRAGNALAEWTADQEALLLAGWQVKNKKAMSKILGHCEGVCRKRFRELTGET